MSLDTAHRLGISRGLPRSRGHDLQKSQKDCSIALDNYRCTPLQQKLREGTCAVPGPRQCPHPPHRGHPRQSGENGLPTMPTAAYLAAEGNRANHRAREGGKRKIALVSFEPTCRHVVCAMKCGGDPTQPTYNHQSITARHQSRPV